MIDEYFNVFNFMYREITREPGFPTIIALQLSQLYLSACCFLTCPSANCIFLPCFTLVEEHYQLKASCQRYCIRVRRKLITRKMYKNQTSQENKGTEITINHQRTGLPLQL